MAKFYISTGALRRVVSENDPLKAAVKAIRLESQVDPETPIGMLTLVSERGFDVVHPNDVAISLNAIIDAMTQLE